MAYDFFPKTTKEIVDKLHKKFPSENVAEIVMLHERLRQAYPQVETPINIDLGQKKKANVSRYIESETTIAKINKLANINILKLKFGNGSSGNRGANNRGNLFEPEFADDILRWWSGDQVRSIDNRRAIEHINQVYGLRKSSFLKVDVVGGENTKRPIDFTSSNIVLTNPKGSGTDVGESVTDVTLHTDNGPIYLSLKMGPTTTFFNVGIRTILTPQEIENGRITNRNGKRLLDLFGIDHDKFCAVFKGGKNDLPQYSGIEKASYSKSKMKKLLESGIGHNYHIVHKLSGKVISKEMSKAMMKKSADVGTLKLYYGGKTGGARRINMEMKSSVYKFSLNIRDTQGKDGKPTRMMCDFKYI